MTNLKTHTETFYHQKPNFQKPKTDSQNKTGTPEADPLIYGTWYMTEVTLQISGVKTDYSVNGTGMMGYR